MVFERIAAEQRTQGDHLHRRTEQRDDQDGQHQRQPEAAGRRQHDHAHVGAEHEQFAVGEVHHVHDAEDQREAGSHQRQDHARDEAVHGLDDDDVPGDVHKPA